MITHDAGRSLPRGNNPVPSPWLATKITKNQAQSASQRRRGVADLHRPRGCRRAERPDPGASTRDRRGTVNRAIGRISRDGRDQ